MMGSMLTTLASGCKITNNNIVNNSYGVYLIASNVTIQGNYITNSNSSSNSYGISLYNCIGNKITQNTVINSYTFYNPYGIYLNNASANIIELNNLVVVGKTDIYLVMRYLLLQLLWQYSKPKLTIKHKLKHHHGHLPLWFHE